MDCMFIFAVHSLVTFKQLSFDCLHNFLELVMIHHSGSFQSITTNQLRLIYFAHILWLFEMNSEARVYK